jgi:hypothetical protein
MKYKKSHEGYLNYPHDFLYITLPLCGFLLPKGIGAFFMQKFLNNTSIRLIVSGFENI